MAQKIKEPAAKPEDPSLIPRTHMVEGENLPVTFTSVPKHMYTYTHTNKYVHTALVQSLVSYSTGQRDGGGYKLRRVRHIWEVDTTRGRDWFTFIDKRE